MIKDRGILKWQAAAFLPQQGEMARRMWAEAERQPKPEVDSYLAAEFEERVCFAMESNATVVFSVWVDGVTTAVIGNVHVADERRKEYGWRRMVASLAFRLRRSLALAWRNKTCIWLTFKSV